MIRFLLTFIVGAFALTSHAGINFYNQTLANKVLNENKELVKNLKKKYSAKEINPVFDPLAGDTLIGYQIVARSTAALGSYAGNWMPNSKYAPIAIADKYGNLIIPFDYSYIEPQYDEATKLKYFRVARDTDRDNLYFNGIFTLDGKMLVPCEGASINLLPQHNGNGTYSSKLRKFAGRTGYYKCPPSDQSFSIVTYPKKLTIFYNKDGKEMLRCANPGRLPGLLIADTSGKYGSPETISQDHPEDYWYVHNSGTDFDRSVGLFSSDGTEILPYGFTRINIAVDTVDSPDAPDFCITEIKNYAGTTKGVFSLTEKKFILPMSFSDIYYDRNRNVWRVKRLEFSEFEDYNPEYDYVANRFPNKGILSCHNEEYSETFLYYNENAPQNPMDAYYCALAYYNAGNKNWGKNYGKYKFCENSKKIGRLVNSWEWVDRDFQLSIDCLNSGIKSTDDFFEANKEKKWVGSDSIYFNELNKVRENSVKILDQQTAMYAIQDDIKAYIEECKPKIVKAEEARRKYMAEQERKIKEARERKERMEKLDRMIAQIKIYQSIVQEGQARIAANERAKAAAKGGNSSMRGGSGAKGYSGSSDNGDTQDKKRRLEWLFKAQKEYLAKVAEREDYVATHKGESSAVRQLTAYRQKLQEIENEINLLQ